MANAWQGYVDKSLIGSGHMHSAAICDLSDGSFWAKGGKTLPTAAEVKDMLKIVNNPADANAHGFKIGGKKYFAVRAEKGHVVGKLGTGGACFSVSKKAIVVGIAGDGANLADTNATVQSVVDYLVKSSY